MCYGIDVFCYVTSYRFLWIYIMSEPINQYQTASSDPETPNYGKSSSLLNIRLSLAQKIGLTSLFVMLFLRGRGGEFA